MFTSSWVSAFSLYPKIKTSVSLFTATFFFIYKHKWHWTSLHFYFSPYLKFYKISLNLVSLFSSSESSLKHQWISFLLFSWKSAQMSLIFISTGRVHEWWEWLTAYVQFWPQREKGFLTKCHFCLTHCNDSSVQQFFTKIGGFRTFLLKSFSGILGFVCFWIVLLLRIYVPHLFESPQKQ